MNPRRKKYIPNHRFNPAHQAKRIDKLAEALEVHQRQIQAISASHDNHIAHLANFARHDIKNTIQNIDSILSTTAADQFTDKTVESLTGFLDIIRTTIDNFAKLVPYSTTGMFKLQDLMVAVQILSRAYMQENKIAMNFEFPRQTTIEIDLPFHSVFQMLNNLIINSIKSLEGVEAKQMSICAAISDDFFCIKIKDNGVEIEASEVDNIFGYGYSTTGGSGIGLYHAKYLCDNFKGEITVDLTQEDQYNKTFSIKLPLILPSNGKNSLNN